jgi:hypothetical protein
MYVPEWETLAAALNRVQTTGLDAEQAKKPVGWAMADRKIEVRVHCADGCVLEGSRIDVPKRLNPEDFDWVRSRPRKPWRRRPTVADHYESRNVVIDVTLIELRREDVTRVLCLWNDTPATTAIEMPTIIEPTADTPAERLAPKSFPSDALPAGGDAPPGSDTLFESWTYYQAVAFLAYGSVEVAARYGGSNNASDGGKAQRVRNLSFPLRSGLPGIAPVLAIKDPNERDIALYGIKATTTQWRGAGLGKDKPPGEQTIECRNPDGWEAVDEERWKAGVTRLYEALLTGAVKAYRKTTAYAPSGLIDPQPAEIWKRGLAGVERCLFEAAELLALAEDHVKPEFFEPAVPSALEQFQARIAALRSFTVLDAKARIVYGAAYDKRYATLPGDPDAEQEAQHRWKRDKRYGSGLTIVTPSVGCKSPGGAGADGVPHSRVTPPRKPEPADNRPDALIEAKNKAKAAEAMAWAAAAQQLCDWLWDGVVESQDRDGNTVSSRFYDDVNNLREATARSYRVRADGLLALIKGRDPTRLAGADGATAPAQAAAPELRKAPDAKIHEMISGVYDVAQARGMKPPNIREIAAPVVGRLAKAGFIATPTRIRYLAGDPRYNGRRLRPGPRVNGTLPPFTDPEM